MKITLESTDKITNLIGEYGQMEARLWEGYTETGIPIAAFITLIRVPADQSWQAIEQFDRELEKRRAPSPEVEAILSRLVL